MRVDAPPTLAELVPKVEWITVPTGAGISTDSGIPADPPCGARAGVRGSATVSCGQALDGAVGHGARLVIINAGETPYDGLADAVLRRPTGEVPPRLAGRALGTGR